MTIRRLIFILFLYILLVWVVAALLHGGDAKQWIYTGLLWTAVGVGALLVIVVLERLISWWWARRARKAAQPAAPVAPPRALPEDDAEFIRLLREADQKLAQAPGRAGATSFRTLPLYLVLGPERAGKTAIVHNCGIEPALLAGQAVDGDGSAAPTRVANLWLAGESLFLEIGGRVFNREPARLAELLSLLQPGGGARGWRGWLKIFQPPIRLRGVVLTVDSRAFAGTPEPSALDRCALQVRERLSAVSGVAETECPVYVVFTNADAIPYFEEFFSGVADGEAGQVLGILTSDTPEGHMQERVWAEGETKRLNRFLQALFLRLSDRRLLALTQESDPRHRAAIYEFPREFRRIRAPLVQFLVDVFKPDPLKARPRLRGFFFTGIRKEERAAAPSRDEHSAHWTSGMAPDATRIFSPAAAASTIFRPRPQAGHGALVNRWMFLTEFFHSVLGSDRPSMRRGPARFEQYRKIAVAAAGGLASVMALLWTISWVGNRSLTASVSERILEVRRGSDDLSLMNLQALDRLRAQLEQLGEDRWYLHWGLYQGNDLRQVARRVYFQRLKRLSLDRLNQTIAADLSHAGSSGTDENATYDELKTHRTITVLACPANPSFLSRELNRASVSAYPGLSDSQRDLLAAQLKFYAADLAKTGKLPVPLNEDPAAETNAQAYLRQARGPAQKLRLLLDQIDQTVPRIVAADSVHDLKLVLKGQEDIRGAFTVQGRQRFEDLVAQGNLGSEEPCVMGTPVSHEVAKALDPGMKGQLQALYYEQYIAVWREFLASYHVLGYPHGYASAEDAASKLDRMAAPRSPLMGLVRLVADNTNFRTDPEARGLLDKTGDVVKGLVGDKTSKGGAKLEQVLADRSSQMTAADVAKIFQPAIYTAATGSDQLVAENNHAYIGGLRALQGKMDALAHASSPTEKTTDLGETRTAQFQARNSLKQMADNFRDSRSGGLDGVLTALLEEPIDLADALLVFKSPVITKNEELRQQICVPIGPVLKKYPFNQSAKAGASLEEIETWFAPNSGRVWRYAAGSGAALVALHGDRWEPGVSPDMKASAELLTFLNASQKLSKAFFADGGAKAGFTYKLRPVGGQTVVAIQLTLDGAKLDSGESSLQKIFHWPSASAEKQGASANRVLGPGSTDGFGAYGDLWGVFRLFKIAESRPVGTKLVQWSYHQGADGAERQPFSPPAKVEFVELPADQDVFNPAFFDSLGQCPKAAAIAN